MKNILVLGLLLISLMAFSYEWTNLMDEESNTNHIYNSLTTGNIYYSTSQGVRVFDGDTSYLYSYGGLGAFGIAENDYDRFVALGLGSYSDGLYTLDDSGNFELVDWYYLPKFLDTGSYTQNIYFSSENNFQINEANEWSTPAEFLFKEVTDVTESPAYQFVTSNDGFYHKLIGETGLFADRQNFGTIQSNEINEASGLVASRSNPGVLWTHNDSGGGNFIFALNELGHHLGIYTVNEASNRDWEDMAIGNNPSTGQPEIYLADIGDNQLSNNTKFIHIVPEPQVSPSQNPTALELTASHTISFVYPDNINYDAETLLYDQRTSTFYVITKRHANNSETYDKIFSINYDLDSEIQVATYEGQVNIPVDGIVNHGATGGDISPDGNFILVKNYQNVFMWERRNLSIPEALSQPYIEVPYIMEPQGEAIAWRYDNNGYFTVSEEYGNIPAVLYFYSKKGWRKASPLPIKKSEYNHQDGNLYGVIYTEAENNGLWSSSDLGITWERINNYPIYGDISVDALGVVFLSHIPTVIPEDWERVTGYYQGSFIDFSSGLEDKIIHSLVKNTIFDMATVFACTNSGVYNLQDYDGVSNEDEDLLPAPKLTTYPNPFSQQISISAPKEDIVSTKIYNLKGQLLKNLSIKKGNEEVVWKPHSSIPNGIYFIKVQTSEATYTSKVLKIN